MTKLTQTLVRWCGWGISTVLIGIVLTFQLFVKTEIPSYTKIGVPAVIAALILFFICYKYLRGLINRKLTAAETAKQLGHAVSPAFTVLNDILLVVPVALTGVIFLLAGQWSHQIGLILLECSGIAQFGFGANFLTRIAENGRLKQAEIDKITANNTAIAQEVKRLITVEERGD